MRVGSKRPGWRRRAAGAVLALSVAAAGPAVAACSSSLPSCWAERWDDSCVDTPTRACVLELRLRLLDRAMSEDREANRQLFHEQSFEIAWRSRSLDEARRVAALGQIWGFEPDSHGEAVRAFADPRFDWNGRLAAGDVVGAFAATPGPELSSSYVWLDRVIDTIFLRAVALGRGGDVLQAIAESHIASSNWDTARASLVFGWFKRLLAGEIPTDLADRLIALAPTEKAVSMRLARAAVDADPAEIGRAIAREYPDGTAARHDHDPQEAIWGAFRLLEPQPAPVRERFLDALPRSVSGKGSVFVSFSLDGPVIAGEVGVVRRLVARTLPGDQAMSAYLRQKGQRSEAIAASLTELDPPDRFGATGLMAEVLFAEGKVDRAMEIASSAEMRRSFFGGGSTSSQADALALAALRAPPSKATKRFLALFPAEDLERLRAKADQTRRGEAALVLFASDGGETTSLDADTLDAAFDLARDRDDCRAMARLARARGEEGGVASMVRDFARVASCVDEKEARR